VTSSSTRALARFHRAKTWACCQQAGHDLRARLSAGPQRGFLPGVPVAGVGTAGELLDDRRGAVELDQPDA
jgi:hypothetical protein